MRRARKKKQNVNPPAPSSVGWRLLLPAAIALVVVIVTAVGIWWIKGRHAGTRPTDARATVALPNQPFAKLIGKWLRPDGGYIMHIKSVDATGGMVAAYLNPKPINVAKASAALSNGTIGVFVELRDVNYPGSTYNLTYDAMNDRLTGIYFQAVEKQYFDVCFVRTPQ